MVKKIVFATLLACSFLALKAAEAPQNKEVLLVNSQCSIVVNSIENGSNAAVVMRGPKTKTKGDHKFVIPFIAVHDTFSDLVTRKIKFPNQALQIIIQDKKWRLWFDESGIYRVLEAVNDEVGYDDQPQRLKSPIELSDKFSESFKKNKELVAYFCLLVSKDNTVNLK